MTSARMVAIALGLLAVGGASGATGELRAGESAVHDFEVLPGDRRIEVVLSWKDRATEWDLVVRSANGAFVTGSTPGLSIEKGPFSYRLLLDPRCAGKLGWAGTWSVRLRLLDTHRKRPVVAYTFSAGGRGAGDVELELRGLGGVHRVGDRVTLEVRTRAKGEERLSVTAVSAAIRSLGDAPPILMTLRDDGEEPDRAAGDGLWTGELVWEAAGRFGVQVKASAVDAAGRPSEHELTREVRVRPARSDLESKP